MKYSYKSQELSKKYRSLYHNWQSGWSSRIIWDRWNYNKV